MARTTNIANKPPIGVVIVTALKSQNKTQRELAKAINTTPSWINWIINGKCLPSPIILLKIARELQLDVDSLVYALEKSR